MLAANLDGTTRELYCITQDGRAMARLNPSRREMIPPVSESSDAERISACMLSDRQYLAWTGRSQMPWSTVGSTREQWCHIMPGDLNSAGQYACNRITDDSFPTGVFSSLAPIECGKRAQMGNPRVCVTDDAAGRLMAERMLATYAAAFSSFDTYNAPEVTQRVLTNTPFVGAPYMCLVRRGVGSPAPVPQSCTPVGAPAANLPIPFDPGTAPDGYVFEAASGSLLHFTWNTQSATIPIGGVASAEIEEGPGGFRLTELQLTQSAPAQLSAGVTVIDGHVDLENLWVGDVTGSSVVVQHATNWVQAAATVGGAPQHMRMFAQSPPTGTWSGGALDLDGTWRDNDNNITYALHLHLTQSRFRPSASVLAVSAVEPECRRYPDGFVGADVTLYGALSASTGQWSVVAGDTSIALVPVATPLTGGPLDPLTVALPLLGPDGPHAGILLSTVDGPLTAFARRSDVRVVDHTPPTILQTVIDIPCRWLAPERTKCIGVPGQFNDNCSATTSEVLGGWAYNSAWELIYTAPNSKCFTAPPNALLPNVYFYIVAYRVRDTWRNVSAMHYALFTIEHAPPTDPACTERLRPVIWWDWG